MIQKWFPGNGHLVRAQLAGLRAQTTLMMDSTHTRVVLPLRLVHPIRCRRSLARARQNQTKPSPAFFRFDQSAFLREQIPTPNLFLKAAAKVLDGGLTPIPF